MNVDYGMNECAWVCMWCGSQTKLGRKHSGSKGVNLYTLDLIYCLFDL